MTLTSAFQALTTHLQSLRDEFASLRTTIREDKPLTGDVVFVGMLSDLTDEWLGRVEEALAAAHEGLWAVEQGSGLDRTWRALTTCQQTCTHLEYRFFDLISYDRTAPFMRFGRQEGGEWQAWVNSVKETLVRCQQPLYAVNQALFRCWQEVAERVGMTSVSVQATNIGQQIAVPQNWEAERETMP